MSTDNSAVLSHGATSGRHSLGNRAFHGVSLLFAILVLTTLAAMLVSLAQGAMPALEKFGIFHFYSTEAWNPAKHIFGGLSPIVGTLVSSAIALILALPVAFGVALFITEVAPTYLRGPIGVAIELLAAIPSIIYGMWGLFVFAPFFADHIQPVLENTLGRLPLIGQLFQGLPIGISVFTAGIVLSIMILPFIASVMRDVFSIVPPILKESAYGLGATTWEVVWKVVLPYAKRGVVGGVMLGLGRALGETMAVTFVIGNAHALSIGLFNPGNSIASTIANEFTEADGVLYTSSLIAIGLMLFVISVVVLAASRFMLTRLSAHQEGKGA